MAILIFLKWMVLLLLVAITLPGVIELLLLTFAAFRPSQTQESLSEDSAANIRLAVVVPAHDEENGISATIESLIACKNPLALTDIHVIADNCSDKTAEIAAGFGCSVIERFNEQERGKGYALNYAFAQLEGRGYDGFLIVDADTRVEANFLDQYRHLFASGAAAGQASYKVGNAEQGLRPRLMYIAFLAFNHLRPLSRHRMGLSCGILGNGFGLSAKTLEAVPYDSFSIVEDLEYHVRLVASGRRVHFLSDTCVWSDMPVTAKDAESQRERWEGGRFRTVQERVPQLAKQLLDSGNKRLIEPIFDLLLLPLSYHGLLLLIIVILGSGVVAAYGFIGLLLLVAHVVIAMLLGKATLDDWKALASAPFYILWKVVNLKKVIAAARKTAEWRRTSR